ncbi:fumarate reductase [Bacteroidales bacterium]|nr:fumarate reductase [Bacteroidales bacterium]
MLMNLTLVFSAEVYDTICVLLGANWYAIAATSVLALGFVVHIVYGIILTLQNQKARGGDKYAVTGKTTTTWASQNMLVLGLVILGFLVLHLYHFWYKMQFSELFHLEGAVAEGSGLVIALFSQPIYTLIYLVWLVAIWFHLTHGLWSSMQSLGLNNKLWYPRVKCIANIVTTIIIIGFSVVPIFFTFKALFWAGACCPGA